jgi:guanylate kinase
MSNDVPRTGSLFIVSAPSGAGKTSVVESLVRRLDGVVRSRSYTSRAARGKELDGVAYNFVSLERFEAMIAGDQFLEHAKYGGNYYGTATLDTDRELLAGRDVILVIEVQGARLVRARRPECVSIFLLPPSAGELERRLRERGEDTEEQIARRLRIARDEVQAYGEYDYVVVNDVLETCVDEVGAIVRAQRLVLSNRAAETAAIVASFDAVPVRQG